MNINRIQATPRFGDVRPVAVGPKWVAEPMFQTTLQGMFGGVYSKNDTFAVVRYAETDEGPAGFLLITNETEGSPDGALDAFRQEVIPAQQATGGDHTETTAAAARVVAAQATRGWLAQHPIRFNRPFDLSEIFSRNAIALPPA